MKKRTPKLSSPPDRETDRSALEEERLLTIRDIGEDRDKGLRAVGFDGGIKRLAEVLRKIKEAGDEERR